VELDQIVKGLAGDLNLETGAVMHYGGLGKRTESSTKMGHKKKGIHLQNLCHVI